MTLTAFRIVTHEKMGAACAVSLAVEAPKLATYHLPLAAIIANYFSVRAPSRLE